MHYTGSDPEQWWIGRILEIFSKHDRLQRTDAIDIIQKDTGLHESMIQTYLNTMVKQDLLSKLEDYAGRGKLRITWYSLKRESVGNIEQRAAKEYKMVELVKEKLTEFDRLFSAFDERCDTMKAWPAAIGIDCLYILLNHLQHTVQHFRDAVYAKHQRFTKDWNILLDQISERKNKVYLLSKRGTNRHAELVLSFVRYFAGIHYEDSIHALDSHIIPYGFYPSKADKQKSVRPSKQRKKKSKKKR
jgi:hypothetical protein